MAMSDYMLDSNFLKRLDFQQEREIYARIISLDNNDIPKEEIVGRVTTGSVNVDGSSAVRRTCSLSMVAYENEDIPLLNDPYWCYNTKFKLEIGERNFVDSNYPDIIWFKMGVYVITSFSKNRTASALNISIQGQDKMCRLNGTVSGSLPMSTDFGIEETNEKIIETDPSTGKTIETFQTTLRKLTIAEIIQNAVREYGQETPSNIIINDLDQYGYELWEYRGDTEMPMYLYLKDNNNKIEVSNMSLGGNELTESVKQFYSFNTLDPSYNNSATQVNDYKIAKIEFGETAGYHRIPLVYNTDLILGIGETVVSLLDKLKNMLGDFEYFYDLNGRFVFQKKNTYISELFSPIDGSRATPIMVASQYSYKFDDNILFTTINNTPNINELKNSFSVWGVRSGITGQELPIHARCAIQTKPREYVLPYDRYEKSKEFCYLDMQKIKDAEENAGESPEDRVAAYEKALQEYGDILYYDEQNTGFTLIKLQGDLQSVADYFHHFRIYAIKETTKALNQIYRKHESYYTEAIIGTDEEYYYKIENSYEKIDPNASMNIYQLPFYTKVFNKDTTLTVDIYDWRELIYQMAIDFYQHGQEPDYQQRLEAANPGLVKNGKTGYEEYYSDLQAFWRELYNPLETDNDRLIKEINQFEYYDTGTSEHWNKKIHSDPNSLNFWFEFIEPTGELNKISVDKIGSRAKAINDTSIKSIYYKETPEVLFTITPEETNDGDYEDTLSLTPIQITKDMEILFNKSAQGLSIIEKINTLMGQSIQVAEGISLTSMPIYYLQPNTCIYIAGQGDYTVDKINYSLAYNGTMTITGNKIPKQIF